jgi:hypothetical protein
LDARGRAFRVNSLRSPSLSVEDNPIDIQFAEIGTFHFVGGPQEFALIVASLNSGE